MTRLRAILRTLRELSPLTGPGALFLLGALAAFLLYGVRREDLLLFVIGGLGLALAAVCLLSTLLGLAGTLWRLRRLPPLSPLSLETLQPAPTPFALRDPWAPFVSLDWTWARPAAELERTLDGFTHRERVRLLQRGDYDAIQRKISVEDCFGLFRVTFTHRQPAALRVQPAVGALRNIQVLQGISAGDAFEHPDGDPLGDRLDMRRYTAGDPVRYVLWTVFARSRQLVVRTPERALSPAHSTVAYLIAGADDEPAAGAARLAVEEGALGQDWLLGADGSPKPASEVEAAMALIRRSAEAPGGEGLAGFLAGGAGRAVRRALVFCPATPGVWLDAVERAFHADPGVRANFIVCADGLERAERAPTRWRRWAMQPTPPSGAPDPAAVGEVLRRLAALGGELSLVDRRAGAVFSAAQLQRLMAA